MNDVTANTTPAKTSDQILARGWKRDLLKDGIHDQVLNLERQLDDAAIQREILEGRLSVARDRFSELSNNVVVIQSRYNDGMRVLHEVAEHLAKGEADATEQAEILAELLQEAVGANVSMAIREKLLQRRLRTQR